MTFLRLAGLLLLAIVAVPAFAEETADKPLAGERIGGEWHDNRVSKRIDNRLPSRLQTRIEPRIILNPLATANSRITAAPTNGCATTPGADPTPTCGPPR